jgi:integrase
MRARIDALVKDNRRQFPQVLHRYTAFSYAANYMQKTCKERTFEAHSAGSSRLRLYIMREPTALLASRIAASQVRRLDLIEADTWSSSRSSANRSPALRRWASTGCTSGGTAACSGPGSSRQASPAAGRCTWPGTPPARPYKTGNLKAVQKLLGHSSITTTADIYTDRDIDQLAATMREVTGEGKK